MRMSGIKTETYTIDGKWMVDIQTDGDSYYAYLWHEEYGFKDLMFGCPAEQQSYEEFLDIVEANFEEYKAIYIDEVLDNGIMEQRGGAEMKKMYVLSYTRKDGERVTNQLYTAEFLSKIVTDIEEWGGKDICIVEYKDGKED